MKELRTKGLMSRTMAVHVRYKSLYISFADQILRCLETRTKPAHFFWFLVQSYHCPPDSVS